MLPEEIEEQELLESWLSAKKGQKVTIRVPKKGTKEKLVELAEENARMVLSKDKERLKTRRRPHDRCCEGDNIFTGTGTDHPHGSI